MKSRRRNVVFGLLFVLSFFAIAAAVYLTERNSFGIHPEKESSTGKEDDQEGREQFEWMRLHDPASGSIPADIRSKELAFAATLPTAERAASLQKSSGTPVLTWAEAGPVNVGGRTRALGIDIANPTTILAGGVSGGMWRSTNDGAVWIKTTTLNQLQSVTCLAQDKRPGKTNVWYYGTGEYRGNSANGGGASYTGDGIFKSTDGGITWTALAATSTAVPQTFDQVFDYVFNVATDSTRAADIVLAATASSIMRSTNGGTSWTAVLGALSNNSSQYSDVAFAPDGIAYAVMSSRDFLGTYLSNAKGFYRSIDGGATWTNITAAGFPANYRRMVIGIAPSSPNTVYFLGETPATGYQTINSEATSLWRYSYVSGDGSGAGGTWVDRSLNLPAFGGTNSVGNFINQGSYDLVMKVKPDDPNFVFVGGSNLYSSSDGFASTANSKWIGGYDAAGTSYANYSNHHPDQHALVFSPTNPNAAYSGHDGGISKSASITAAPVVWTTLNNGYKTAQFYSLALDHARGGDNLLIGGTQDNGTWMTTSASASAPWGQPMGGDGGFSGVADSGSTLYGSFQNATTYKIAFNRVTGAPTAYTQIDPTGISGYLFINPYTLDPGNTNQMYFAGGNILYRNSDLSTANRSANWTAMTSASNAGIISAIGISKVSPAHRVYFGTTAGAIRRLDNADTASASAASVDVSTGKGFPSSAYVSCIAVDPINGNNALVAFSNYSVVSIFSTADGGANWSAVAGNLEQNVNGSGNGPSVRWVSVVRRGTALTYFAGTSVGLFSTQLLNGTSTVWVQEGAAVIGNSVVDMIDSRTVDGKVAVATHGVGVFWSQISATSVSEAAVPQSVRLEANYPNPFNPSTIIRYAIPARTFVRLTVYDLLGREVQQLVNGEQEMGNREIRFDAAGLASGVYYARLESGGKTSAIKMLLMK